MNDDNKYPIKFTHEEYNALIDAVIADSTAAEREACIQAIGDLIRSHKANDNDDDEYPDIFDAVEAIRARGQI